MIVVAHLSLLVMWWTGSPSRKPHPCWDLPHCNPETVSGHSRVKGGQQSFGSRKKVGCSFFLLEFLVCIFFCCITANSWPTSCLHMMHLWEFCKLQRNYKEAKYTKYNFKVQSDFSVQFKRPVWLCKDLVNVSLLKFSWKFNLSYTHEPQ